MKRLLTQYMSVFGGGESAHGPSHDGLLSPGASSPGLKDDSKFTLPAKPNNSQRHHPSREVGEGEAESRPAPSASSVPPGVDPRKGHSPVSPIRRRRRRSSTTSTSKTFLSQPPPPPPPPSRKRATVKMAATKPSKQPVPIKVQVLPLSEQHSYPYLASGVVPKFTFTLNLLPQTRIKELCLHAGEYVRRNENAFVDATRLEARDQDGYAFGGHEMISDELVGGETLYLVEDGLEKGRLGKKEALQALLQRDGGGSGSGSFSSVSASARRRSFSLGLRTPSVSSRASSVRQGKQQQQQRSEPKKTPSQRALEIAQGGRVVLVPLGPRSAEPRGRSLVRSVSARRRGSSLFSSAAESKSRVQTQAWQRQQQQKQQQRGEKATEFADAVEDEDEDEDDAAVAVAVAVAVTAPTKNKDASINAIASQQSLPSPASSPSFPPQDFSTTEFVIPDSPNPPNPPNPPTQPTEPIAVVVDIPSQDAAARVLSNSKSPLMSFDPPDTHTCSSAPLLSVTANLPPLSLDEAHRETGRLEPACKLDPYDISAVLSDDEKANDLLCSNKNNKNNNIMTSSVRKLGSAAKANNRAAAPASQPIARNSLLITRQQPPLSVPVSKFRTAAADAQTTTASGSASTPAHARAAAPSPTPIVAHNTGQSSFSSSSSPLAALCPSSPTNLVAAVLARDHTKTKRQQLQGLQQQRPRSYNYVTLDGSEDEDEDDAEANEHVMHDARNRFSSPQPSQPSQQHLLEASLPWSAPPLRIEGLLGSEVDELWSLRAVGRRTSAPGGGGGGGGALVRMEDEDGERDAKADIRKLVELDKKNAAVVAEGGKVQAGARLPASSISIPPHTPSLKSPATWTAPPQATTSTPGKLPVLLVHGSSSSVEGVEEVGCVKSSRRKPSLPSTAAGSSPSTGLVIHGSDSQDDSDYTRRTSERIDWGGRPGGDNLPVEEPPLPEMPENNDEPGLPCIVGQRDRPMESPGRHQVDLTARREEDDSPSFPSQPLKPASVTDTPKTNPVVDDTANVTPPSAQPSKRKREPSLSPGESITHEPRKTKKKKMSRPAEPGPKPRPEPEPKPESEEATKRQRRKEAKAARRAKRQADKERRRRDEQEGAAAAAAHKEEERKRIALEQAHRRAIELQIAVSSPLKAPHSDNEEENRPSGGGSSGSSVRVAKGGRANSSLKQQQQRRKSADGPLSSSFKRSDTNDNSALSREEGERRSSLSTPSLVPRRKLSKRHSSASVEGRGRRKSVHGSSDVADPPAEQQQQQQQAARQNAPVGVGIGMDMDMGSEVKEQPQPQPQFQRPVFDNWAFLEATLGHGGGGYHSGLEVHNRIHMAMMIHAGLYGSGSPASVKEEDKDEDVMPPAFKETSLGTLKKTVVGAAKKVAKGKGTSETPAATSNLPPPPPPPRGFGPQMLGEDDDEEDKSVGIAPHSSIRSATAAPPEAMAVATPRASKANRPEKRYHGKSSVKAERRRNKEKVMQKTSPAKKKWLPTK